MSSCLTPAEIEAFLSGTLLPEEKARADSHLAGCEKCRKELEARGADIRLFAKIKDAHRGETVSAQPEPGRTQIDARDNTLGPSVSIEGYDILAEIHRGGQGIVYKAIQKATKRTVALKVLLEGPFASPRQRYRFEREIDLVAGLQHPNIVTVYDSGVTRDDRHYFAMEYVHGLPLDEYLSDKTLSIEDTLRLFAKICAAVNYAHQRGVIHRDLKPGNIRIDASGEPHVLDFGLAKAAGPAFTGDGAPVTATGEFMGTPAYASPEQTKGDPNLIDIRTDVYSLGVILYEMLTGKYPYEVAGVMADVLRNITEAEPRKPSIIRRRIDDEVETIVLKALAKEKERRYQSAGALSRDIEHYLGGEPIDAKRDSTWYVLRKTLHRYRVPVTAASVVFAVGLGIAAVMTVVGYSAGKKAERIQREFENLVDQGLVMSQQDDWKSAEEFYRSALKINPDSVRALINLANLNKDRFNRGGPKELLHEALGLAGRATRLAPDYPIAWNTYGVILKKLKHYPEAAAAYRRALELDPTECAAWENLGVVLALEGGLQEAEQALRRAAGLADTPFYVGAWRNLGAVQLESGSTDAVQSLLRARELNRDDPATWLLLARAHLELDATRDDKEALIAARGAESRAPDDPRAKRILAWALLRNEGYSEAIQAANQALELGGDVPTNRLLLAMAHAHLGNLDEARHHCTAAVAAWPLVLQAQGVRRSAEKGALWFERYRDLADLRAEADRLIGPDSGAP